MSKKDKLLELLNMSKAADDAIIQIMDARHPNFDSKELKGKKLRDCVDEYLKAVYERAGREEFNLIMNYRDPSISTGGLTGVLRRLK